MAAATAGLYSALQHADSQPSALALAPLPAGATRPGCCGPTSRTRARSRFTSTDTKQARPWEELRTGPVRCDPGVAGARSASEVRSKRTADEVVLRGRDIGQAPQ